MIVRKPLPLDIDFQQYNNGSLFEYDPFLLENNQLVIDEQWWHELSEYARQKITSKLYTGTDIVLKHVEVPHKYYDSLAWINQIYLDSFDYHHWHDQLLIDIRPKGVIMLNITNWKQKLNNNEDCSDLIEHIKIHLNSKDYFVRLSSTSGKNAKDVRPFSEATDIVEHLQSNYIFKQREYQVDKDTYLIMVPWNSEFDKRYEFRIFVVNGKLTAASQQWWTTLHNYDVDELDTIQDILGDADFSNIPYKTFVADIYFNLEDKSYMIIELNPFGAFCGAGAALFNWQTDYDLLYGKSEKIEMRYLSVINI